MRPATVEEHLAPAEVARRLGVDVSTVWRWVARGELGPVRKLGHRITRIPASAVQRMLERHTIPTRP